MLVNGQSDVDSVNEKVSEFSENVETIREILRRYLGDNAVQVTDIVCSPGSNDGDNYMSLIKRIVVKIKTNNNAEYSTSLIVKRHIVDKKRRELFRCDYAFENEIAAYCHLIPVLKKFSNDNLPYPNCLFAGCDGAGEIIAMKDLKEDGYKMANRTLGLDFEHCSLVLKELASFHAISLAMKIVDPVKFYDAVSKMHEVVFTASATDFYSQVLDNTLKGAVSSLTNFSNSAGDLDKPIEILKCLKGEQLYRIMHNHVKNSSNNWKVICHGDLWINNLMFHYHNDKVKHVKFVDLQTIRYSNLTCDILMLLYSSTEGDLRHKHMDRLIQIYRESLISNLREHLEKSYQPELASLEKEFTFESIKAEFADRSMYGLATSLWVMPAITFKSLSNELDSFVGSLIDQRKKHEKHEPKEFHTRVRDIVKEFYDRGFLDNIFIDI